MHSLTSMYLGTGPLIILIGKPDVHLKYHSYPSGYRDLRRLSQYLHSLHTLGLELGLNIDAAFSRSLLRAVPILQEWDSH